jgi:hypothetical protein
MVSERDYACMDASTRRLLREQVATLEDKARSLRRVLDGEIPLPQRVQHSETLADLERELQQLGVPLVPRAVVKVPRSPKAAELGRGVYCPK